MFDQECPTTQVENNSYSTSNPYDFLACLASRDCFTSTANQLCLGCARSCIILDKKSAVPRRAVKRIYGFVIDIRPMKSTIQLSLITEICQLIGLDSFTYVQGEAAN
jgi:hypothetical protein